ncbi:RNB domain-containing ribonuclease [Candidatus Thiodictyon syntrophicum]|uniref:Exoribonuclease II n=1 Tax=Candidatus Thiodictyon syntrophicum TaxID=1166950 RepID=A0A2K8U4V9_9GAMM|nr:RNB domain-containing ribonuclease [Candidatus Thiodictyon syntrophicum]AUB80626.1 exoribonuclease II [Candidatus Thiodictyon syntrophicum]
MSTHQPSPPANSLVLYKVHPARIVNLGEKIEIELAGGQSKRVRAKDIELLHPGPLRSLTELAPQQGEPEAAWELLEGAETTLQELAELAFNAFTPATAWAAWQLVADGLSFSGTPAAIRARTREEVERIRAERGAKANAESDWQAFLVRMADSCPAPEDGARLGEVERLALGQSERSRILEALGHEQTPINAHRALIQVGYWTDRHNPYPRRCAVPTAEPGQPVPGLIEEDRLDLTALPAYAIDDVGNQDPDDALSLDGDCLWVHVADVAALVATEGEIEREARARGSNLYLPEGVINMLPAGVTEALGLGLQPLSPALSFALRCDDQGELLSVAVHRTWIRAQRLTYDEVDGRLTEEPFAALRALTDRFRARRTAAGATSLDLPEVSVRVEDGRVTIRPLPRLASRELVADAMLMAGEGAARFCLEHAIPIPFATQAPPEAGEQPRDLAAMYARRRAFKPSRLVGAPDPHAGLGLALYTRATSPLRRYSDLLVHQQIRAWLAGLPTLTAEQVTERIGEAETAAALVRRTERLSNLHWKLVYLKDHPDWQGQATIVGKEDRKGVALVPLLALETRLRLREEPALNQGLRVAVRDVDIPAQTVSFRVLG